MAETELGRCPMKMLTEATWKPMECDGEGCEWWIQESMQCCMKSLAVNLQKLKCGIMWAIDECYKQHKDT